MTCAPRTFGPTLTCRVLLRCPCGGTFRVQVNMHCPYSKIHSLQLEPGDYVVQVEGYSRYEGKFNLNLLCESDCA